MFGSIGVAAASSVCVVPEPPELEIKGEEPKSQADIQKLMSALLFTRNEFVAFLGRALSDGSITRLNGVGQPIDPDSMPGFVPMSGTEPQPLALSREPKHYGAEIPARALRW